MAWLLEASILMWELTLTNLIVLTYCRVTHSYARLFPAVLY